jgi:hypothetical protein
MHYRYHIYPNLISVHFFANLSLLSLLLCTNFSLGRRQNKSYFQTVRMPSKEIYYSDKYTDDKYEYRHVMLPKVS